MPLSNEVKCRLDGQEGRVGVIELESLFGLPSVAGSTLGVAVANVAPFAALSGPDRVEEGGVFTLSIEPPVDPGDDRVSEVIVDWGDGSDLESFETLEPDELGFVPTLTAPHVYADGDATHSLEVSLVDEDGTHVNDQTLTVEVDNVAPIIGLDGPAAVDEGSIFTLTLGEVSDPGTDTVTEYRVFWGDGSTFNGNNFETFFSAGQVSHVYNGAGERTIVVDLRDEDGTFPGAGTFALFVNDVPPRIALSGAAEVEEGSEYTLILGEVTDPGAGSLAHDHDLIPIIQLE